MWSGPRNLSTAMMRSFGNRADTFVSDEPYYGAFLEGERRRPSDARRGDRGDGLRLARASRGRSPGRSPGGAPIWYQKHMWHHMVGPVGYDGFRRLHPRLPDPRPGADDRLLSAQARGRGVRGFRARAAGGFLRARGRPARPCAAGGRRRRRARRSGRRRCARCARALGIAFDPAMLRWPAGRRATDGPWAPHWYQAVEASTGFGPPEPPPADLPDDARRLADRCRPYYDRLAAHRLAGCVRRMRHSLRHDRRGDGPCALGRRSHWRSPSPVRPAGRWSVGNQSAQGGPFARARRDHLACARAAATACSARWNGDAVTQEAILQRGVAALEEAIRSRRRGGRT